MDIDLYEFAKKPNSTKRPTGDSGRMFEGLLKEPFSVLAPVVKFRTVTNPTSYNYAYIGEFGRYYHITNWSFDRGMWYASMSVDPLASWRTEIGRHELYVLRSSAESDGFIGDATYPVTGAITRDSSVFDNPWEVSSGGCFVMGCVSSNPTSRGSTTYYALTPGEMRDFINYLMTDITQWAEISEDEISTKLQQALVNPLDHITTVFWLPLSIDSIVQRQATATNAIKFGFWEYRAASTTHVAHIVNIQTAALQGSATLKRHPQSSRGHYLNCSPYTAINAFFPPFGDLSIDTSMLAATELDTITYNITLDIGTGEAVLELFAGDSTARAALITRARTNIGVNIPLSRLTYNVSTNAGLIYAAVKSGYNLLSSSSAASAPTGYITTPMIDAPALHIPAQTESDTIQTSSAGDKLANIIDSIGAGFMEAHNIGTTGTFAEYQLPSPYLQFVFARVTEEENSHFGRPLCAKRKVSDIAGYMQISSPDLEIPASAPEIAAISATMAGGMFYE